MSEEPLGWVPVEGRGSLPFSLVHGESLVAAASWAMGEAGIWLYDASVTFEQVRTSGRSLVLHDPLCPLAPADLLREAVELSEATDTVVVGYRPVTDTVKVADEGALGATVDRTGLRAVASPIVVPARVLAESEPIDASDFPALVARLASVSPLTWLEVPPLARRVHDAQDLRDLEALSHAQRAGPSGRAVVAE